MDADKQEQRRRERAEKLVNGSVTTLTPMQREFVIEYLVTGNATKAAEKAGYSYPDKAGPRLSKEEKIQAVISEFYFGREMEAREVIQRLGQQGRAEYAKYLSERELPVLDKDGELVGHRYVVGVDVNQMLADGKGHLIKGVKETQYGQTVEFFDAQSALVHIGRYHGLFTDRTDLTTDGEPLQPVIYLPDNERD